MMFNASDWYWRVANDPSRVYSSKRNIYVNPALDADFQAWMTSQGLSAAVPIGSEAEVWDYVKDILPTWVRDPATGSFAYPGQDLYSKPQLKNYSLGQRFAHENGGMNSVTVAARLRTDDPSKQLISIAASLAKGNPNYVTRSIHPDAAVINGGDVVAIEKELGDFIEAVFEVYATLNGEIDSGTITQLTEVFQAYEAVAPSPS